ncbi:kelch repeat protein, putative [Perkinsus marinus ATCC 50983]|uniref:Kelch repeat protein, putative n=1 Tax=Perkinsus marinus (strain ATCC 50983 / TXsc) TaxID=423536 RepID=C5LMB7_PERM5|nr:kelch repeat protein, putative [Perkinsus marinus ATCC 50983]EER02129.1 kelch repeat protein, putative [Perkinsus marinus ATCC 50983]|eukprot:XP_002769411.1 kelch repeat protein, putative [Perkinsus marinus ATCC 50983]
MKVMVNGDRSRMATATLVGRFEKPLRPLCQVVLEIAAAASPHGRSVARGRPTSADFGQSRPRPMTQVALGVPELSRYYSDGGPRAAHSCDVIDGNLYIFGGWNGKKALNDLYVLDIPTFHWYEVVMPRGTPLPAARNNHTTAVVDGRLFIHGGHDGGKWLADTHVLVNLDYPEHRLAGQQLQQRLRQDLPASPQLQRTVSYPSGSPAGLYPQLQPGSASTPGVRSNSVGGRTANVSSLTVDTTTGHGGASMYASGGNLSGQGNGDPGSTAESECGMVAVRVTTDALFSAWHQPLIKKRKMRRYVRCLECYCAICGQVLPITNSAYSSLRWIKAITSGQPPSARACHTLSRLNKKLYMFGGYDGQKCFNDMGRGI